MSWYDMTKSTDIFGAVNSITNVHGSLDKLSTAVTDTPVSVTKYVMLHFFIQQVSEMN